jgi:hypothetical protein
MDRELMESTLFSDDKFYESMKRDWNNNTLQVSTGIVTA